MDWTHTEVYDLRPAVYTTSYFWVNARKLAF